LVSVQMKVKYNNNINGGGQERLPHMVTALP
jgi:hypothetical protein